MPLIIGEIRRFLRDSSVVRVSRSLRDVAYRAMQAKERLQQELSRDPTVDELAKEIGLPREEVVMALDAITEPVSLYEPLYADSGDAVYVLDQIGGNENDRDWLEELALKDAIRALPEREKTILHLRFFVGLTQMEVSRAIGISQAQVSRLEKGALTKIKSRL